jgi:hypothetical protein
VKEKHGNFKIKFKIKKEDVKFINASFVGLVDTDEDVKVTDLPEEARAGLDEDQLEELPKDQLTGGALLRFLLTIDLSAGMPEGMVLPEGWELAGGKFKLNATAVQTLPADILVVMTSVQLMKFDVSVMQSLSVDQYAKIKGDALVGLDKEYLRAVPEEAAKKLPKPVALKIAMNLDKEADADLMAKFKAEGAAGSEAKVSLTKEDVADLDIENLPPEKMVALVEEADIPDEVVAEMPASAKVQIFINLQMKGKDAGRFMPPGWMVNAHSQMELTVDAVKQLTPTVMVSFTAIQIGSFAPTVMASFSMEQVRNIPATAMAGLTVDQMRAMPPEAVRGLNATQVANISVNVIMGLNATQVGNIPEVAVAGLNATQVGAMPPEAVGGMKPTQVASLTTEAVTGMNADQIKALTPDAAKGFTPAQIPMITITAVIGFTVPQLTVMAPETRAAFKPEQRVKMPQFIFDPAYVYYEEEPVAEEEEEDTTKGDEVAEGEETTVAEGEETAEGEDTAAEGEDTEGEDTAAEGEDTATEGEDTVAEGEDTAAEGEDTEGEETAITEELGATAVNAEGELVETEAVVTGGITNADGTLTDSISLADDVDVGGEIALDPNDVGNIDDVFVYASYVPVETPDAEPLYFMLGEGGVILVWDQTPENLASFQKVKNKGKDNKKKPLKVEMYKGKFILPGILKITFGYRLEDGSMVSNDKPVEVTIAEEPEATEETEADAATETEGTEGETATTEETAEGEAEGEAATTEEVAEGEGETAATDTTEEVAEGEGDASTSEEATAGETTTTTPTDETAEERETTTTTPAEGETATTTSTEGTDETVATTP